MCGVCGCDVTEDEGTLTRLPARAHADEHSHAHGAHARDHEHPHPHAHEHEHGHEHGHGQEHGHEYDPSRLLRLEHAVLAKNDRFAERNRGFFGARGVLALNLTSSPGAGKTTLLERMIRDLSAVPVSLAVIEGDQETQNDARRIRAAGCRAIQINTGAGCHLDAERVGIAARNLAPERGSVVFIENVGNLVCPAMFDLGENAKVVVLSVTEGEDKPVKYPHMFRAATAMVLSKTDLLPHLDFDVTACLAHARRVNPALRIFPVSVRNGSGLAPLYEWLRERLAQAKEEAQ